jgi:hypothetical protein
MVVAYFSHVEIIVKRGEEQFGPFSPDQLKEHLSSGMILKDDWAWHDGLADWVPAQTLVENSPAANTIPKQIDDAVTQSRGEHYRPKATFGGKPVILAAGLTLLIGGLVAAYFLGIFEGGQKGPDPTAADLGPVAGKTVGSGDGTGDGEGGEVGGQGNINGGSSGIVEIPPIATPVSPPVAIDSSTSYSVVTHKLDPGGSFYFYLSTAQAQQWVQTVFTEGGNMVKEMGGGGAPPNEGDPAEELIGGMGAMIAQSVGPGIDLGQAVYAGLGLDSIDGVGASTKDLGGGLKRNVSVVHHDPARGEGLLWKAFGEAPHELGALNLMPIETVYAMHGDLNLTLILQWVQTMVKDHGPPEMLGELNTFLKSPPFLAVNGGYGGEMGFYVTFDPVKTIKLPVGGSVLSGGDGGPDKTIEEEAAPATENSLATPPIRIPPPEAGSTSLNAGIPALPSGEGGMQMIEIPEPGIIITIKVKDVSIQKMMEGAMAALMPLQPVDLGGVTISQLPEPMPLPDLPVAIQPAMFQAGDYLVITSTPALAQKVVAVHNGQNQGIKGTPEFQKMSKGLPLKGNQLFYVSGRVKAFYEKMHKEFLATGMGDGLPKPVEEMLTKFTTMGSSAGLSVVQMQPDGMVMRTNTEGMGYDTVALAGAIAMPVAAAGAFWVAGSFAENLLGGSSDSFDGGFELPMEEDFPEEAEGEEASIEETGPATAPKKK